MTIDDWYKKDTSRVEVFELSDGLMLFENQVQQLVDAMAIFDVQAAGDLNVSQEHVNSVQSVLAAAWSTT